MEIETYDLVVFGGGKAGKTLAMDQARAGKRVAMIERGLIGGSCINIACIPSKTLIRSARIAHVAGIAEYFGSHTDVATNMAEVADRTASVVAEMVETNRSAFEASGLDLVLGWGRFVEPRVIEVATDKGPRRITAERIYLNLGTVADVPDLPGLRAAQPLTHVEALKLGVRPDHLIVLGGGYIGLELGQAFRRLGARVTIIERGPQIAGREDADVAEMLRSTLSQACVEVVTDAGDIRFEGTSGTGVTAVTGNGKRIEGSHLLVAVGRRPMTSDIGLDLAGVTLDARGFIQVDETLQTSAPGIWALGEVAGTPMFTHASLDDYRVAKSGIVGGSYTSTGRLIPYCVFTDPELARVGLNEREAKAQGIAYRIARLPMHVVPRARTLGERKGMMKALVGADDRILGFTMLGAEAGEVMTSVQMAMLGGLPYTALRDGIIAHPTLAEGLNMLFAKLEDPA